MVVAVNEDAIFARIVNLRQLVDAETQEPVRSLLHEFCNTLISIGCPNREAQARHRLDQVYDGIPGVRCEGCED